MLALVSLDLLPGAQETELDGEDGVFIPYSGSVSPCYMGNGKRVVRLRLAGNKSKKRRGVYLLTRMPAPEDANTFFDKPVDSPDVIGALYFGASKSYKTQLNDKFSSILSEIQEAKNKKSEE